MYCTGVCVLVLKTIVQFRHKYSRNHLLKRIDQVQLSGVLSLFKLIILLFALWSNKSCC